MRAYTLWEKFCGYQLKKMSDNKVGVQLYLHTHRYSSMHIRVAAFHKGMFKIGYINVYHAEKVFVIMQLARK